ncbi:hypothetical protein B0919_14070 [Hymenobacter sp. CRA2]|nr:hypothetical protein B0919_14070 [Hymenobacter sp. CRA2]
MPGLLSSCQSSRPAFYFGARPAPAHGAAAVASVKAAAPPDSAFGASSAAAVARPAANARITAPQRLRQPRSTHQLSRFAPKRQNPADSRARVAGRAVRRGAFQQRPHRNAADYDHGKALGETILAALYVVGLAVLLILLLSATTATGQLIWGIALGVAALPLLYWIGRVVAALIRPAGNARQHRRAFVNERPRHLISSARQPGLSEAELFLICVALVGIALLLRLLLGISFLGALAIAVFGVPLLVIWAMLLIDLARNSSPRKS